MGSPKGIEYTRKLGRSSSAVSPSVSGIFSLFSVAGSSRVRESDEKQKEKKGKGSADCFPFPSAAESAVLVFIFALSVSVGLRGLVDFGGIWRLLAHFRALVLCSTCRPLLFRTLCVGVSRRKRLGKRQWLCCPGETLAPDWEIGNQICLVLSLPFGEGCRVATAIRQRFRVAEALQVGLSGCAGCWVLLGYSLSVLVVAVLILRSVLSARLSSATWIVAYELPVSPVLRCYAVSLYF